MKTDQSYWVNRSRIISNKLTKILLVSLILLLTGCSLWDDEDDADDAGSNNITLQLQIVDDQGLALEGALASSGDVDIVSQEYDSNARLAVEIKPSSDSLVLRIDKTGYDTGLLFLPNGQSPVTSTVMLKKRLPPIIFDGLTGGDFAGIDGAQVSIAAESLVRADGSPASGDISLYINTVDTSDSDQQAAFPGSFEGLASADTEPGILASLGVTSFRFEQNGEKLQLKAGESSQLTIPLYAGEYEDGTAIPLGDLIPLWRLNEETGIWEEESTGVVVAMATSPTGLGLQATTSHFSSFNADIWARNSGLFGNQSGPAAQSRSLPQVCRVSVQVPEFEDGERYTARVVMNLGALLSTRPMSGIYYEPFTFPVFQGRPASLRLIQPSYNNNEGRGTVESFTCNADTMDLIVTFEAVPAFFSVEASAEPVFEQVNGQQTVTKNQLYIKANFINDAMDDVQITTNFGYENLLVNNQAIVIDYLATEPDPASIAFYLENDLGTADTLLTVDYVSESAPIVQAAYANNYENSPSFMWTGAIGADDVDIFQYDLGTDTLGAILASGIDATAEGGIYDASALNPPGGWYMLIFGNQYGETQIPVFLSTAEDNCLPNSDIPCTL